MDTLPAGACPANPARVLATRRTMLTGIAAIPTLAVAGCPTAAPAATGAVATAIAASRRASAISSVYHRRICQPLRDRVEAQIAVLPATVVTYRDDADLSHELRTGEDFTTWFVTHYRKGTPYMMKGQPEWLQDAVRRFDVADSARDAEIERIREASGLLYANERSDDLGEASCKALDEVASASVSTIAELNEKIAYLIERDWWEDVPSELIDDIRRLAGEGC